MQPDESEWHWDPEASDEDEEVGDQMQTDGGSEGGVVQLHQTISSAKASHTWLVTPGGWSCHSGQQSLQAGVSDASLGSSYVADQACREDTEWIQQPQLIKELRLRGVVVSEEVEKIFQESLKFIQEF